MHKRIRELARGKFEYSKPILQISPDRVEIEVLEGKNYVGEFTITSINEVPVKGRAYSSSSRMDCLTPQFEGTEVNIRYEFHSEGLVEGDIQKGNFYFICNQGEYNLSFVVTVIRLYAKSSIGSIRSLNDFTRLAKLHWEEALRVFYSSSFKNLIHRNEESERLIYDGIIKSPPSDQNMEEFLAAVHKKEKVRLTIQPGQTAFYGVVQKRQEKITLNKENWGYLALHVTTDAAFLRISKRKVTSADFVGSVFEYEYLIDGDRLHGGKNYGTIVFENAYQKEEIVICASAEAEKERDGTSQEIRRTQMELIRIYESYRMEKMVTGKWASKSAVLLDHLFALTRGDIWYRLLKAQALLVNRQNQEAEWILEEFKREWKEKQSPQWGYYLYLCTLRDREENFVNKMTMEIETIYRQSREESEMLFWCLLFLREDFTDNPQRKLRALEAKIKNGSRNPLLYAETYHLYLIEPYLLTKLGSFELTILNWARKQKVLTGEIAEIILKILPSVKEYSRLLLYLLEACYDIDPKPEMISAVCSYLIKAQKFGHAYFSWYAKGVEEKLRITGLYEAYVSSMDSRSIVEVPKIVLMYFRYHSALDYRKKSVLYVNIIANKQRNLKMYREYQNVIECFAMEEMEKGHMDDNLAVIYEDMLSQGVFSNEIAMQLSDILFTHKITCFSKKAAKAIVIQKQLKKPQIVPITGGCAYFRLYSNDYCIFIEDTEGNRYAGGISYQLERLMHPARYLRTCLHLSGGALPYLINYFSKKNCLAFLPEDEQYFRILLDSEKLSEEYKAKLYPQILFYYERNGRDDMLEEYLELAGEFKLSQKEQTKVTELLIFALKYEKAYQMIQAYGADFLKDTALVSIVSYEIKALHFEEDETLTALSAKMFVRGKYDDAILKYLCRNYHGPVKIMSRIFSAAKEFQIDVTELAERILIQMLYTTEFVENIYEIFDTYEPEGRKEVLFSYFTYFSQTSFVDQAVAPEHFFLLLEKYIEEGDICDVCSFALLSHLSEKKELSPFEERLLDRLLENCIKRGLYFGFYRNFAPELLEKYHLHDKLFLEYRTDPGKRVVIRYKRAEDSGNFKTQEMTQMYDGIFVKAFLLYDLEDLQYYITEEEKAFCETTESGMITREPNPNQAGRSRFAMINGMCKLLEDEDRENLVVGMKEYEKTRIQALELFPVL